MLHSLAHLLMTAMTLECGYATASLGERIYCAPANDPPPMAAILILTGSSGAEGTLGGWLSRAATSITTCVAPLRWARSARTTPSAPATPGENDHSERPLEGAACHGCLYIAEPSCERFNSYLDRALVVPARRHPKELAFFGVCP